MSARKLKTSWWVDLRYAGIRYRVRSPENSRGGAAAYEAHLRSKLARGIAVGQDEPRPATFAEFADEWLVSYVDVNNKPSERLAKRSLLTKGLVPFFGRRLLRDITSREIEQYKGHLVARNLSPKTMNNHLTVLRKALTTAKEWGRLDHVPEIRWMRVAQPVPRFLTRDEVDRLLAVPTPSPWREMISVAVNTGLRVGELLALQWDDVDLARGLTVRRSVTRGIVGSPKNYRTRVVPLTVEAQSALAALRLAARPGAPLVFAKGDEPAPYHAAQHHLARAARRAGLARVSWHVLRHTFASLLVQNGAPMRAIQRLLGHSTVTMTERYAHVGPSNLESAVACFPSSTWATGGQPERTAAEQPPTMVARVR